MYSSTAPEAEPIIFPVYVHILWINEKKPFPMQLHQ